ncbi:MAG TPA: MauE/DoxX family redox-associated membrane protein [Chthoniobacter sp.]|jgi:uncharacterized membrane protein YphA (DoxX/SURF4 family)
MAGKIIVFLIRLGVAVVFLYAGVLKIWDFHRGHSATPDFNLAIQHFKLSLPPDLTLLIAVYLPWLELTAAITLFVRRLALGAATAAAGMTTVFLIALASAWHRGLDISCGCFGKDEVSTNYPTLLTRDALLLAAALVLVVAEARRSGRRSAAPNP